MYSAPAATEPRIVPESPVKEVTPMKATSYSPFQATWKTGAVSEPPLYSAPAVTEPELAAESLVEEGTPIKATSYSPFQATWKSGTKSEPPLYPAPAGTKSEVAPESWVEEVTPMKATSYSPFRATWKSGTKSEPSLYSAPAATEPELAPESWVEKVTPMKATSYSPFQATWKTAAASQPPLYSASAVAEPKIVPESSVEVVAPMKATSYSPFQATWKTGAVSEPPLYTATAVAEPKRVPESSVEEVAPVKASSYSPFQETWKTAAASQPPLYPAAAVAEPKRVPESSVEKVAPVKASSYSPFQATWKTGTKSDAPLYSAPAVAEPEPAAESSVEEVTRIKATSYSPFRATWKTAATSQPPLYSAPAVAEPKIVPESSVEEVTPMKAASYSPFQATWKTGAVSESPLYPAAAVAEPKRVPESPVEKVALVKASSYSPFQATWKTGTQSEAPLYSVPAATETEPVSVSSPAKVAPMIASSFTPFQASWKTSTVAEPPLYQPPDPAAAATDAPKPKVAVTPTNTSSYAPYQATWKTGTVSESPPYQGQVEPTLGAPDEKPPVQPSSYMDALGGGGSRRKESLYAPSRASWKTSSASASTPLYEAPSSQDEAAAERIGLPSDGSTSGSYMDVLAGGSSQVKASSYSPNTASWKTGVVSSSKPLYELPREIAEPESSVPDVPIASTNTPYTDSLGGGGSQIKASSFAPYQASWKTILRTSQPPHDSLRESSAPVSSNASSGGSYMETLGGGGSRQRKASSYAPNKASWKTSSVSAYESPAAPTLESTSEAPLQPESRDNAPKHTTAAPSTRSYMDALGGGGSQMKASSFAPNKGSWKSSSVGASKPLHESPSSPVADSESTSQPPHDSLRESSAPVSSDASSGGSYMETLGGGGSRQRKASSYAPNKASWKTSSVSASKPLYESPAAPTLESTSEAPLQPESRDNAPKHTTAAPSTRSYMDALGGGGSQMKASSFAPNKGSWKSSSVGASKPLYEPPSSPVADSEPASSGERRSSGGSYMDAVSGGSRKASSFAPSKASWTISSVQASKPLYEAPPAVRPIDSSATSSGGSYADALGDGRRQTKASSYIPVKASWKKSPASSQEQRLVPPDEEARFEANIVPSEIEPPRNVFGDRSVGQTKTSYAPFQASWKSNVSSDRCAAPDSLGLSSQTIVGGQEWSFAQNPAFRGSGVVVDPPLFSGAREPSAEDDTLSGRTAPRGSKVKSPKSYAPFQESWKLSMQRLRGFFGS